CRPDNRIERYYGLWKRSRLYAKFLPENEYMKEFVSESENGLRYFGAVNFSPDQLEKVHTYMKGRDAFIVVLAPFERSYLENLLEKGWQEGEPLPPPAILKTLQEHKCVLIHIAGEFDDYDVIVSALGSKEIVFSLMG